MEAIVFEEVNKIFKRGEVALENVSVHIRKGEFVFVIGRSGAGKSTFLKLVSAQEKLTSGRIWVNGREISALSKRELPYFRRQIGIM